MHRLFLALAACVVLSLPFGPSAISVTASAGTPRPGGRVVRSPAAASYTLLAWSDLGMHCISPRFADMAILPPYNNLRAVVIQRAAEPHVVEEGVTVKYSIDNNQSVAGKTDFWQYAFQLFGAHLQPGIGLTGKGLSGTLEWDRQMFRADGVPVLPYNDSKVWNPYQRATMSLFVGTATQAAATASIVVPVSDEMFCAKCHNGRANPVLKGAPVMTLEQKILALHDEREGTNLSNARPVLCGSCHADAALGTPGSPGVPSLSYAMHVKHASIATRQPACYDCHPGSKTQCNRSAIEGMGPITVNHRSNPRCEMCHGNLTQMAAALVAGRKPWVEEPTCAQCHGAAYSTGTTLFREARGHGDIQCAACHNSPHAWWPSLREDDNYAVRTLQGSNHAVGYNACYVCHTDGRTGLMPPHGDDRRPANSSKRSKAVEKEKDD